MSERKDTGIFAEHTDGGIIIHDDRPVTDNEVTGAYVDMHQLLDVMMLVSEEEGGS